MTPVVKEYDFLWIESNIGDSLGREKKLVWQYKTTQKQYRKVQTKDENLQLQLLPRSRTVVKGAQFYGIIKISFHSLPINNARIVGFIIFVLLLFRISSIKLIEIESFTLFLKSYYKLIRYELNTMQQDSSQYCTVHGVPTYNRLLA